MKVAGYFRHPLPPIDWQAAGCGLVVILTMLFLPRVRPVRGIPAALVGIALATGLAWGLGWGTATIGTIPRSIVLEDRLIPNRSDLDLVPQLILRRLPSGCSVRSRVCSAVSSAGV